MTKTGGDKVISDTDRAILEFESTHPRNDRSKEAAIMDSFGFNWVHYHRRLMQLTHDQDAVAAYREKSWGQRVTFHPATSS